MAKFVSTAVLDASLDAVAAGTEMYYCNGQPASRADAIARQSAPAIALAPGDFSKANGATGVRVLTVAAKTTNASVAQVTDHVAICTATTLLYVTPGAVSQNTNVGAPVNSTAFTYTAGPIA